MNDLGIAYRRRSEYSTAKYYLEQALDLAKDKDFLENLKANGLHELAIVERNLGSIEQAITLETQAMQIFDCIGDIKMKAACLHQLAGIYANQGEVARAIEL